MRRGAASLAVVAAITVALWAACGGAGAATAEGVDFESAAPAPSMLPGVAGPVTSGDVTVSGGTVLEATPLMPSDQTVVYGTCAPAISTLCAGLSPSLTIDFAAPVHDVSIHVYNRIDVRATYTLTDDTGGVQQATLDQSFLDGNGTLTLPGPAIRHVTLTSDRTATNDWIYFVDDVTAVTDDVVVPLPAPTPAVVTTKAQCQDGGWAAYVDGAGRRFRNQGDCVSYVATRGKNSARG
jgi:hypothetical protein